MVDANGLGLHPGARCNIETYGYITRDFLPLPDKVILLSSRESASVSTNPSALPAGHSKLLVAVTK